VEVEALAETEKILNETIQTSIDEEKGFLMGRLTKDIDLMDGILAACQKHGITAGSVNCIGSLTKATLVQVAVENGQIGYSDPIVWESPVELLSGTGFIGFDVNGDPDIHFHGTYVNHHGQISGGHFLRGENPTAVTIEFIVQFSNKIQLQRNIDEVWNLPVFQFTNRGDSQNGNDRKSS
jgi:uncharacterized protein